MIVDTNGLSAWWLNEPSIKLPVISCDDHFDHVAGLTRIGW